MARPRTLSRPEIPVACSYSRVCVSAAKPRRRLFPDSRRERRFHRPAEVMPGPATGRASRLRVTLKEEMRL